MGQKIVLEFMLKIINKYKIKKIRIKTANRNRTKFFWTEIIEEEIMNYGKLWNYIEE